MDKVLYGAIGLITVLLAFGGGLWLSQDEFNKAYVCSTNEVVGIFDRLSSTSKTGYYTDENGELKSKVCREGEWIKLKAYAEARGLKPEDFIRAETAEQPTEPITEQPEQPIREVTIRTTDPEPLKFCCDSAGCYQKEQGEACSRG